MLGRRRRAALASLEEDIRQHLDEAIRENLALGMTPEEARRAAMDRFGNVIRTREDTRAVWSVIWLDQLVQDLRYAFRTLARTPGFTAVAILTLAIGVGGATAVFSVVHSVVLEPLPYGEPDRLVRVSVRRTGTQFSSTVPFEEDWHTRQRVFADIIRYTSQPLTPLGGEPVRIYAPAVPPRFTQFLQVRPVIGRGFAPDEVTDPPSVALVSYRFWRDRLGGDPAAVGSPIPTDLGPLTVVGVMPEGFAFYYTEEPAEMWVPGEEPAAGGITLARLRPGVSAAAAEAELNAILREIRDEYPGFLDREIELASMVDATVGADWQRVLFLFLGAVGFVLVIAVANVVNLTLARGIGRERELAIRSAVGSTRTRLVRQLLVESTVLSALGGATGVLLTVWGLRFVVAALPAGFPRATEIGIDGNVLGFALATSLVAGVAFGIVPAVGYSEPALDRVLKDAGRGSTDPRWRRRVRSALIAGEVALATVLLAGALLLTQSFVNLIGTPLGLDLANVVSIRTIPASQYDQSARSALWGGLAEWLRQRPDVEAVSGSNFAGLSAVYANLTINGQVAETRDDLTPVILADPPFFEVLGIGIVDGRVYREGEETAAVVTESFARRHYPDRSAIGQQITRGSIQTATIVGVARDFRLRGPEEDTMEGVIMPDFTTGYAMLARTSGDPSVLMNAVREEIRAIDPTLVVNQTTLEDAFYALDAVSQPGLRATILGTFSVVALLLALVGIAGIVSHSAARRVPEVGIRMALGGTRARILGMMLVQSMTPVVAGVGVGLLGAMALKRTISAYLFDVSAADPPTLLATAVVLVGASVIAAWLPLRRSTAISPMDALRYGQ